MESTFWVYYHEYTYIPIHVEGCLSDPHSLPEDQNVQRLPQIPAITLRKSLIVNYVVGLAIRVKILERQKSRTTFPNRGNAHNKSQLRARSFFANLSNATFLVSKIFHCEISNIGQNYLFLLPPCIVYESPSQVLPLTWSLTHVPLTLPPPPHGMAQSPYIPCVGIKKWRPYTFRMCGRNFRPEN